MNIRILGPMEVEQDGRLVGLGPKQRILLAILLVRHGASVPADRITEELYEGLRPENPGKTLQVHVSRLRKALGAQSELRTSAGGYALVTAPGTLDSKEFEVQVEQGRIALADGDAGVARELLGHALALWRGPALEEFSYAAFAQPEIARLEELRVVAIESRNDADLALGADGSLVGELESIVRQHPLRERLRAQLMLALYRSGRQADALDAYQAARAALVDELGIEPGRALRDLQQAILAQDPALDLKGTAAPDPDTGAETTPLPARVGGRAMRDERKTVTVLHARVDPAAESGDRIDPEVLRNRTTRTFEEIVAAIEAHEGSVDLVAADFVTGVFGVPVVHDDDPARAYRAAEEIHARLAGGADHGKVQVGVRIGVATGVVMTSVPSGLPDSQTAGEPVTIAAGLALEAEAGAIALDDATARALHLQRQEGRLISPMVGRERERRRLVDAYEQAVADRSCQLFTVLGTAGVGKSRLVHEFLEAVGGDARVARGRCLPYGEGITFWPVLEAVKELVDGDHSGAEATSENIAALVADANDPSSVGRHVAELIGVSEATTTPSEERFAALRMFVETVARPRPLALVFDDIHWGKETFLDLVEYLADRCRGASVLLVCMARPELLDTRPGWGGGKLNATSVLLEPLSDDAGGKLVGHLLGDTDVSDDVRTRIANAAEGNPLFLEEMVAMLVDDGLLVREDTGWTASTQLADVPVPPTISALLLARLDRLPAAERAAIECAAVEGKVFHRSSVEALSIHGQEEVIGALDALLRKDLIRHERPVLAGEEGYRFRHLLIRDSAYDAIPKQLRATLHRRHAAWLQARIGAGAVEYDEIVGYHLEQAYAYTNEVGIADDETREVGRHAAELLGAAGRRALLRSDAPAGTNLIARAVAMLDAGEPLRVDLVPNVRAVQGLSDLTWADRVLTDAVEAAATSGNRALAAHALVQRGLLRLFSDSSTTSRELFETAERAIAVFSDLGDDLGLARAWRLVAQAHYLNRSCARCAEASERAFAHVRRAGDPFELREIIEWLIIALLLGPAHGRDGIIRCERLLEEAPGDPLIEAQIQSALATLFEMQGHAADADGALDRGSRVMDEAGQWIWIASFWRSMVYLWRNDPVAAELELRPSYEALKRMGEKSHFSSIAHGLANALYMQRRYDEAEDLTRECEDACRANDVHSHIFWRSTRAKVLARRGDLDDALDLANEAVALAEASDFLPAQAGALEDLAKVLHMASRTDEARAALEASIGRYENKGNAVAAARARRLRVTDAGD